MDMLRINRRFTRRSTQRRGHVLLGLLVLVGLSVAGISWLYWRVPEPGPTLWWLLGGLALAGWSSLAFWRRDSFAAAKLLLFCTLAPAIICLLWAFNGPRRGGLAPWFVGAFMVGALLCARYLWREWRRTEVLPNALLQSAVADDICEVHGLQFLARVVRPQGDSSAPLELHVAVQSCVDAERTLTLKLSEPPQSRLRYQPSTEVVVGPGEVGMLVLPLYPVPGAGAPGRLYLTPSVKGPGGPRVRFWRAKVFVAKVHPVMQVLALATGSILWGGGWFIELPLLPELPQPPAEVPPERWAVVWQPELELLRQARAA